MAKKLWGGRFKKEMHPLLKEFSYSLRTDSRLFFSELKVNEAYSRMLAKVGLITRVECAKIQKGLQKIQKDWHSGNSCLCHGDYEDIHTYIQQELERVAGPVAKKIHTGRSRNDLVITSTLVYLKEKAKQIESGIAKTQTALVSLAEDADDFVIPGLTHLRKAQPVLAAHHLLAYVEMLEQDKDRLKDAQKRLDVLPLGSAALAGSALPLDRAFLAKQLGFSKITRNSLAATADRASLTEVLSALSILWMHLSRFSEDMILWQNEAFGYIELDDAFATGSSLMPQKKNPDIFELIRGRAAVIFSHLSALLTLQKGLPLAYNRDLQEDKPGLFDAIRKTEIALELLALSVPLIRFQESALSKALEDDGLFATDILEYLIRKKIPFAEAHESVGKVVRHAVDVKISLQKLPLAEWRKFSKAFDQDVFDLLNPQVSVKSKKTLGSTNPGLVHVQLLAWKAALKNQA